MTGVRLNDGFLAEVGLNGLSAPMRRAFLNHVYDTLQLEVGERMSVGLSDAALAEFEAIVEGREDVIDEWLAQHAASGELSLAHPPHGELMDAASKEEYVTARWLELHRPDYESIVQSVFDELKAEIIRNRQSILDATEDSATSVAAAHKSNPSHRTFT